MVLKIRPSARATLDWFVLEGKMGNDLESQGRKCKYIYIYIFNGHQEIGKS